MQNATELIGFSAAMCEIGQEVLCASRSDAKVLITGESGVGKEVVARLIHSRSRRSHRPLVTINCAGVPDTLLESELFGHARGSFTDAYRDRRGWFEQADGGTVFMDEVGEMTLRMQAILLRFLEDGEIQRVGADRATTRVDVRVIAATNRNLMDRTNDKSFREDLFYRLNVIHIAIPPLRERREDIPPLFEHFIRTYCTHHRTEPPQVLPETMDRLVAHDWPGNVRELRNLAERLVVRRAAEVVSPEECFRSFEDKWSTPAAPVASMPPQRLTPEILFDRMVLGGESFWVAVYEPFISRDLTRHDLRAIVTRGLERTKGSYKAMVQCFNLRPEDYKRFLSFLRKHECHMPFQRFRSLPMRFSEEEQAQRKGA